MKKAVIYTRVSTDTQAEKGYSLRDQEDKIRKYCERNNISIVKHFKEDHSAKDFNRPQWKLLMDFLRKNKREIDEFIFVKWDRFSRNLQESLQVIDELKGLGIKINCLENNIDDTIPENLLLQTLSLVLPEIENRRRSLNTTTGMRRAMKEGRWPRKAPLGYLNTRDSSKRIFVDIDPVKAPLVKEAFQRVAKGMENQADIRRDIERRGLKISKSNFPLMLQNIFYIGKITIPAFQDEPEQIVTGLHKPIISEKLFYKVQEKMLKPYQKRQLTRKKFLRPELPLRGFLTCHNCNSKMTGSYSQGNGGKYYYYHCCNCGVRFKAPTLNQSFENLLKKYKLKDEFRELALQDLKNSSKELRKANSQRLKNCTINLEKLSQRLERLEGAFMDGEISGTDFSSMKKKTEITIDKLRIEKQQLKSDDLKFHRNLMAGVEIISNLHNLYQNSGLEEKRRVIGCTFPRGIVSENYKTRTNNINEVIAWITQAIKPLQKSGNKNSGKNPEFSSLVAPSGIEPLSKV